MGNYPVLAIVCLGTIISAYIGSCVNIALPNIMAALNFNMDSVVWVSLGYLLPYGSMLPLSGKLGDKYGAKNVYLVGLIIFTTASTFCGMATNSTMMVVCRIIQGIGGSMLLPNAMIIVVCNFTGPSRAAALGTWSAMAAAGAAMGPTIGGYLIDVFGWRSIFFSVTPFCLLGVALAAWIIPKSISRLDIRMDYVGGFLLITSISALLIALNQGEKEGWLASYYISMLFYLSIASFVLFILVELHVDSPIVELALFKNLNFTLANIVSGGTFFTLYGSMFLMPFFMKSILNFNSIQVGVMMLAQTVTMVIFAPIGGRLSARIGARLPSFLGLCMASYAFYLLKNIDAHFGTYEFCIPLAIYGIGLGFTMSPLTSCAISTLDKDKIGVGSGVFNFSKMIGGSIGVVIAQIVLTQREIYHTNILKEYLNLASEPSAVYQLVGMLNSRNLFDDSAISTGLATQLWTTSMHLLPEEFAQFKQVLSGMLSSQASVYSFQDVYFSLALLCVLCTILTAFIKEKNHKKTPFKTAHKA